MYYAASSQASYYHQLENQNKTAQEKFGKEIAEYFVGEDGKALQGDQLFPFIAYRDAAEKTKKEKEAEDTSIANGFIRWDALCHILNSHVIPKNPKDNRPIFTISCVQLINEDLPVNESNIRAGKHITPVLMAKVDNPLKGIVNTQNKERFLDSSVDPTICLLPRQMNSALKTDRGKKLQPFILANGYIEAKGSADVGDEFTKMCDYDLTEDEQLFYTGHILLNVKRLLQMYTSMKRDPDGVEKKDFYLYDFIKKIWDNVNEACAGNHDFKLTTDFERPHIVRVVDMRYQEHANLKQEDIIDLNIQSTDSIVRDFAYNTSVPSAMSATIAIAAQSPRDINNIEGASFGAFHKNITNRFAQYNPVVTPGKLEQKEQDALAKSFEDNIETYYKGFNDLAIHIDNIAKGNYLVVGKEGDSIRSEEVGKIKGVVNSIKRSAKDLAKRYPTTKNGHYKGQFIPRIVQEPTSAIIPLKFSATIDGISGIVIGNVFKIPSSRLPKGYKDANVAFVVMGEDQNITSGQDWTTKIIGQMIILDDLSKSGLENNEWASYDFNQFDESDNKKVNYVDGKETDVSEEQRKIDEGLNAVKGNWEKVYLKLNNDYTHLRVSARVNNEGVGDGGDNVIGAFDKGNKGLYLGKVQQVSNQKKYAQNKENGKFYKVDKNGKLVGRPVEPKKLGQSDWPWYKIYLSKDAKKKLKRGWIYGPHTFTGKNRLDKDGADQPNFAKGKNAWGWMRIDVITTKK